jgi:hypothetical protein
MLETDFFFRLKLSKPAGPRKRGEGCDDELQGILEAQETSSGGARLRITLLAAGFIIGEVNHGLSCLLLRASKLH